LTIGEEYAKMATRRDDARNRRRASFVQAPDAILMHALSPIVKSFEPGEDWSGCYADEVKP
jgi:hypothetical protein